jgi:voltage-gated potassium channel
VDANDPAPSRRVVAPGQRLGRLAEATLVRSGGEASGEAPGVRVPCPSRAAHDEEGYERWLARQTERWDPVMAWLGIVFALLVAFQLADPDLSPGWSRGLDGAMWLIWGIFVVDFAAKLIAAPSTLRFLRRHWLAVVMLLVPTLRVLRLGALLRIGRALPAARVVSTSFRASGVARQLVRSRTSYLAALAGVVTLAVAELGWLVERNRDTFATFGDALIWAATCVVALQGDPVPETAIGRLIMLAGFSVGLVLVASLAGTVGAYLLEERREREQAEQP